MINTTRGGLRTTKRLSEPVSYNLSKYNTVTKGKAAKGKAVKGKAVKGKAVKGKAVKGNNKRSLGLFPVPAGAGMFKSCGCSAW